LVIKKFEGSLVKIKMKCDFAFLQQSKTCDIINLGKVFRNEEGGGSFDKVYCGSAQNPSLGDNPIKDTLSLKD
jgi:hypothetical protein